MTITVMTWNVHGSVDRNGDGKSQLRRRLPQLTLLGS